MRRRHSRQRISAGSFIAILIICVLTSAISGAGGAFLMFNLMYSAPEQPSAPVFTIEETTAQSEEEIGSVQETTEKAPQESPTEEALSVYIPEATTAAALSKGDIYSEAVHSVMTIKTAWKQYYSSILGSYYRPVTSSGTGFCVTDDGYIVTNYHVIESAKEITVSDYAGNEYTARLVGGEAANDFAVIKIDAPTVPVKTGASSSLKVGDDIMVIGNALGELTYTFTDGIVSHLSRSISYDNGRTMNMFQTNAAINKGNSGGPVYDMKGEVVGIASAKVSSDNIEGLGFFIPIDDVKGMMYDIILYGYIKGKPSLGITVQTVTTAMSSRYSLPRGCYIVALDKTSPCYEAGMRSGDVITKLGNKSVTSAEGIQEVLAGKSAGENISVTYQSGEETKTVTVTIGEYKPADPRTEYSDVFDI